MILFHLRLHEEGRGEAPGKILINHIKSLVVANIHEGLLSPDVQGKSEVWNCLGGKPAAVYTIIPQQELLRGHWCCALPL